MSFWRATTRLLNVYGSHADPLSRKLAAAPLDDEPFTMEDRQAVAEADESSASNQPIELENVPADLGLAMTDWESMSKASPAS